MHTLLAAGAERLTPRLRLLHALHLALTVLCVVRYVRTVIVENLRVVKRYSKAIVKLRNEPDHCAGRRVNRDRIA